MFHIAVDPHIRGLAKHVICDPGCKSAVIGIPIHRQHGDVIESLPSYLEVLAAAS
jgi:hypothetical protein